jgi:hypothetical protein
VCLCVTNDNSAKTNVQKKTCVQRLKSLKINSEACYEFSYVKSTAQIDGNEPMYVFKLSA